MSISGFWAASLWVCYKLTFCLFDHTRDMFVIYEKVKRACFIHIQSQKEKFASVQINMKLVSNIYIFLNKIIQ